MGILYLFVLSIATVVGAIIGAFIGLTNRWAALAPQQCGRSLQLPS
jgi:hypothetical protein